MKKSKITALVKLREKGEAWIYTVATENGDAGEYYSPKGEAPFKLGEEVEYDIEQSDFGPKFKRPRAAGAGAFLP